MDKKKVVITRKNKNESTTNNQLHNIPDSQGSSNINIDINNSNMDTNPIKDGNEQILKYQINKLDFTQSILLIDTSYWVYYRFFALRNYYKRTNPTIEFTDEYNWLEDKTFMIKYEKMFLNGIFTIATMWNSPMSNVVFCCDCPYKEIWRYQHHTEYKGTRLDTHKRNGFNSFEIFNTVRDIYIPKLIQKYKMSAIQIDKCEADDVVGHLASFLSPHLSKSKNTQIIVTDQTDQKIDRTIPRIIILASDNDYIQICSDQILLVDGIGNQLCEEKKSIGSEKYLIKKILSGDVSDNIPTCNILSEYLDNISIKTKKEYQYRKCTPAIIDKLISHPDTYTKLQTILYELRKGNIIENQLFKDNQYIDNAILIDFKMLPKELYDQLYKTFCNFI